MKGSASDYYEKVFQGRKYLPGDHIVGGCVKNPAPPRNLIEFCKIYTRHAIFVGRDPMHEVVVFTRGKDNTVTANYTTLAKFADHKPVLVAKYGCNTPVDLTTTAFTYEDELSPRLETVELAVALAEEKNLKGCYFFGNHGESIAHACVLGAKELASKFLHRAVLDDAIQVKSDNGLQILWGNACANFSNLVRNGSEAVQKAGQLISNFVSFSETYCKFHGLDETLENELTKCFLELASSKDDTKVFSEHIRRVKKIASKLNFVPLVFFERVSQGIGDDRFLAQYINETLLDSKVKADLKTQVVHFLLAASVVLLASYYEKKYSLPTENLKKSESQVKPTELSKMSLREVFPLRVSNGCNADILSKQTQVPPKPKEKLNEQVSRVQNSQYSEPEVSRLNSLLQAKASECDDWAKKYKSLESTRQQEAEEYNRVISNLKGTGFDIDKVHIRFNAERTAYETQIIQLQLKVTELDSMNKNLQRDNERLIYLSNDRILEIDSLKKRYNELEEAYRLEVGELQSQLELYKSNSFDVKQLAIRYGADKAADQTQINQLKQVSDNLKEELQRVYELVSLRKTDYDDLSQQLENLRKSYDDLNRKSTEFKGIGYSKERIESIIKENESLKRLADERKKQSDTGMALLQQSQQLLETKLQEIDLLKKKYEDAVSNYDRLNSQLFQQLQENPQSKK